MIFPKFLFAHAAVLAFAVPEWIAGVGIFALAIVFIYFLVGAFRAQMKWEDEKEAHRRYGGSAPPKKSIRKLKL